MDDYTKRLGLSFTPEEEIHTINLKEPLDYATSLKYVDQQIEYAVKMDHHDFLVIHHPSEIFGDLTGTVRYYNNKKGYSCTYSKEQDAMVILW